MKKITLLFVFVTMLVSAIQVQAQVNEPANWPNTNWTVVGSYTLSGFASDPTTTSNFSWDDDIAGSGSLFDFIAAESPAIDLTSATTVVPAQEEIIVTVDYVFFSSGDILTLEWWNASEHQWLLWDTFSGNSTNGDFKTCSGMQTYVSPPKIISAFTPSQLVGFKYRIAFNDNGHTFGMCFGSPTLESRETPLCFAVSGVNADPDQMTSTQAVLAWTDNNGVTPQNGWEIEYGATGFTQGTGTSTTTTSNPYTIAGLTADTCYDVYIKALCDNTISSEWTGPYNFCTPIPGAECGGIYIDSGGANGNYSSNENQTTTICPTTVGDVVTIIFTSFNTETNFDELVIHNGDSAAAPILGTYSGTTLPPMTSSTAANGCLTFVFTSDGSVNRSGWEADIYCTPPITCFLPENLQVNVGSITTNTAEVSWTDTNGGSPAGGWDVIYVPIGDDLTTGTAIHAATNPFTITGLAASTEYDYYVRANCGVNSGDDDSFWAGPIAFITKCDPFIAPYSQNFENGGLIPICWDQGGANAEDWMFSNDVTNPGHVGNAGNVNGTTTLSGGYFAWMDDSSPNSTNTTLLSPFVDLTGVAAPTLGFYYVSNDEFFGQHINFSVDVWDGTAWTDGVFTSNSNTAGWEQVFVDLAAFAGQTIQVRFVADETGSGFRDDFAIDDVYIGEMPACVNVNAITVVNVGSTDAILGWTDGGNIPVATAWEIEYGAPGFTQGTVDGTIVAANVNPFTLTGLTAQTDYEFYVRSDCGGGEYSLWAGPIQFTTLCPIFTAPYTEDFEDGGVIDACWTQNAGAGVWEYSNNVTFPEHIGNAGDVGGTTTLSGGYFAYVDDSAPHSLQNTITTPLVDVSSLTTPGLSFFYISDDEGVSNVSFSVDVWDGATWNVGMFTSAANTNGWKQVFVNIDALTITGPVQARFIVDENNGNDFNDDLAIDDVTFGEAPSCYPISDVIASGETTTSVDVSWTDNNTTAPVGGWDIEYVLATLPQGTGTVTNVTAATMTISGLMPSTYYDVYIRANCAADNSDSSTWVGPFRIKTVDGPPLNDMCVDAKALTVTLNCEPTVGNNILATQTVPALATDCADPAVDGLEPGFDLDDVWYKFTMPATGTVIVQTTFAGGMEDSAISIYTGTCGNLVIAENYNPDGSTTGRDTCSDDADADLSAGTNADNNRFGIVQLQNQTIGQEFYVRVWSVDRTNLGNGNIHGQFTICVYGMPSNRFSSTLEVEEEIIENKITLTYYPNPVTDVLNLRANRNIDAVSVYSMLGQEIKRSTYDKSSNNVLMNLKDLESGAYFVKVKIGNTSKSIKIIKK